MKLKKVEKKIEFEFEDVQHVQRHSKKLYFAPHLTVYGTIAEITKHAPVVAKLVGGADAR